jgi:hypothetical protein
LSLPKYYSTSNENNNNSDTTTTTSASNIASTDAPTSTPLAAADLSAALEAALLSFQRPDEPEAMQPTADRTRNDVDDEQTTEEAMSSLVQHFDDKASSETYSNVAQHLLKKHEVLFSAIHGEMVAEVPMLLSSRIMRQYHATMAKRQRSRDKLRRAVAKKRLERQSRKAAAAEARSETEQQQYLDGIQVEKARVHMLLTAPLPDPDVLLRSIGVDHTHPFFDAIHHQAVGIGLNPTWGRLEKRRFLLKTLNFYNKHIDPAQYDTLLVGKGASLNTGDRAFKTSITRKQQRIKEELLKMYPRNEEESEDEFDYDEDAKEMIRNMFGADVFADLDDEDSSSSSYKQ